jgi:hypothetical protein
MATIYNLSLLPEIKQMKRVFIFLSINIGHRWQFSSTCRILSLMKNVELENRPIDRGPGGSMS